METDGEVHGGADWQRSDELGPRVDDGVGVQHQIRHVFHLKRRWINHVLREEIMTWIFFFYVFFFLV